MVSFFYRHFQKELDGPWTGQGRVRNKGETDEKH